MEKVEYMAPARLAVPSGKTVVRVIGTYEESTNAIGDICYLEGIVPMPSYGVYAAIVRISDGHVSLITLDAILAINPKEVLQ